MKIFSIDDLRGIIANGAKVGTIREAGPVEEEDFVLEHDKDCTGIMGRKADGRAFSLTFDQPVFLTAGIRYVVELG